MKYLVVIPTYNCEKQITRVLGEFSDELISLVDKVLILDNQSTDLTKENAQKYIDKNGLKKFSVCKNDHNYSLGGSQKIGFKSAIDERFDYIAILHGDNQAKTEELIGLIKAAEALPAYDAIMGARFMLKSNLQGYSLIRIFGNIGINIIYSFFTGRIIKDLGSGLNLYKVASLKDINFKDCANTLTFNMDLLLELIRKNQKIKYLPITWREVDQVSHAKIFNIGFISLLSLIKWRFFIPKTILNQSYTTSSTWSEK
jgi:glycosyltransferase involved in cell wall biosynthesis